METEIADKKKKLDRDQSQLAMHSRAFLLLQRDLMNLKRYPLKGIDAYPKDGDMFKWCARIEGLIGSIWEDGIFYVSLSFDENFNIRPPAVHFNTIPFHPNVHAMDGSVAITSKSWIKEGTVSSLLLSLQVLLSNPELEMDCIRNYSAAELLSRAPRTYTQTVMDCVLTSIKKDGGFPDLESMEDTVVMERTTTAAESTEDPKSKEREGKENSGRKTEIPVKFVSFDDYHALWKGIATSIVNYKKPKENDLVKLTEKDRHFIRAHTKDDFFSIPIRKQKQRYMVLKYGTLHRSHSFSESEHPGTEDVEDYMYENDKDIAEHINWSQSNHEEELRI